MEVVIIASVCGLWECGDINGVHLCGMCIGFVSLKKMGKLKLLKMQDTF